MRIPSLDPVRWLTPSRKHIVLVVDDEAAILGLVKLRLEREGYTVLTAQNGAEGLECFRKHGGIDLVIADVLMPMLNGRESGNDDRTARWTPSSEFL